MPIVMRFHAGAPVLSSQITPSCGAPRLLANPRKASSFFVVEFVPLVTRGQEVINHEVSDRNVTCRALNSHGKIVMGQIRGPGVSLRVMFEDVSSCIFNGTFTNDTGNGAYICMLSVGIERGVWQVKRANGPQQPS